jgi:hypothetical protein
MKIISFIEDEEVIEKILKHLGLWNVKARPPSEVKVPPVRTKMDYSDSQVSSSEWFYPHPDYPVDFYMRSRLNRAFYSTFQSIILTSKPNPKVNSSRCNHQARVKPTMPGTSNLIFLGVGQ